jgi:hypothetical protein
MGGKSGGGGGGGKKGGGAAPAPDFSKASMVNQSNPLGGATWGKDAQGNLTSSSQFSGEAGQTFQNLLGGMNQAAGMDPAAAGQNAFDKTMGSYKSVLDPMWAANSDKMQGGLANSGLDPGTEAYGNASRTFGNQRDQAYNSAIAGALQAGQGEQAQARANQAQPFNLAGGMMGMLPKNDPNAAMKGATSQYEASKDQASASNSKKGSTLGGLGSIAGTVFGGPIGGMAGGALGSALGGGGGGGGKKGSQPGAQQFVPGDPMAGSFG